MKFIIYKVQKLSMIFQEINMSSLKNLAAL